MPQQVAAQHASDSRWCVALAFCRCLVGFINYSPAKGSNEAWYGPVLKPCCRSTCRYREPDSELWLCLKLSDLGWMRPRNGRSDKMVPIMWNACDIKAKQKGSTFRVFDCVDL
jgi:hypothetical protein